MLLVELAIRNRITIDAYEEEETEPSRACVGFSGRQGVLRYYHILSYLLYVYPCRTTAELM